MDQEWTKAFRIAFPDGFTMDGAQFPQGICVLADRVSGLSTAAFSLEDLPQLKDFPEATVEWASDHFEDSDLGEINVRHSEATKIGKELGFDPPYTLTQDQVNQLFSSLSDIPHLLRLVENLKDSVRPLIVAALECTTREDVDHDVLLNNLIDVASSVPWSVLDILNIESAKE